VLTRILAKSRHLAAVLSSPAALVKMCTMATPLAPVVLITGAAKRIGRTLALDFVRRGWRVGLHYNGSAHDAQHLAAEITGHGGSACTLRANLAENAEAIRLVADCTAALAAPTCLINNAAMFREDEIATLEPELWNAQLAVNLTAPVFLAQAFAAALPHGAEGTIINMVDQRVWKPTPHFFSYSASKMALWDVTRTLAQALAPRIRVNAIGPGPALQGEHQTHEDFQAQCAATILRRGTTPEEIAAAVHFILSAPAMTGQMVALDGGQHLAWETPDIDGFRGAGLGLADTAHAGERRHHRRRDDLVSTPSQTRTNTGDKPRRSRLVFVRDLEIVASVGVFEFEKRYEQPIVLSIDMAVSDTYDGVSDRLADVLDYSRVVDGISRLVQHEHVNLIETLAERIAAHCLADARVHSVRVRIEKPEVMPACRSVGIEIERQRP
jgi:FolB domain-containing protein